MSVWAFRVAPWAALGSGSFLLANWIGWWALLVIVPGAANALVLEIAALAYLRNRAG